MHKTRLRAAAGSRSGQQAAALAQLAAAAALAACCLLLLAQLPGAAATITPDEFARVTAFRDAMRTRGINWEQALSTWTCPTPPANSVGQCDPCGNSYNGNWLHMHCRGNSRGWGESGDGQRTGLVTNIHITDVDLDGPVPRELCLLQHLRELDLDGGQLTGPVPRWLDTCFPDLEELDFSFNRLTGDLPDYLAKMPRLSEVKFEDNFLVGTISRAFGGMKLRRFQVEYNDMEGPIPDTFRNVNPVLTQLHLAGNNFSGNLSMLAGGHLTTVTVHNNPGLCGMVPASVRYAKNYNPAGDQTGTALLGWRCVAGKGMVQSGQVPCGVVLVSVPAARTRAVHWLVGGAVGLSLGSADS